MDAIGMSSEEWAAVCRYHDDWVQKGELELRTDKLRSLRSTGVLRRPTRPAETTLRERDEMLVSVSD